MSRLSKAVRRVSLGPIVTVLVKMVEAWLGKGTGALKKELVEEIMKVIVKIFTKAGLKLPENAAETVEELIETNVTLLNETGAFQHAGGLVATAEPVKVAKPRGPRKTRLVPAGDESEGSEDITDFDLDEDTD